MQIFFFSKHQGQATRSDLVVKGLNSIHEVKGSNIIATNIQKKKKKKKHQVAFHKDVCQRLNNSYEF